MALSADQGPPQSQQQNGSQLDFLSLLASVADRPTSSRRSNSTTTEAAAARNSLKTTETSHAEATVQLLTLPIKPSSATGQRQLPTATDTTLTAASFGDESTSSMETDDNINTDETGAVDATRKRPREGRDSSRASDKTETTPRDLPDYNNEDEEPLRDPNAVLPMDAVTKSATAQLKSDAYGDASAAATVHGDDHYSQTSVTAGASVATNGRRDVVIRHGRKLRCSDASASSPPPPSVGSAVMETMEMKVTSASHTAAASALTKKSPGRRRKRDKRESSMEAASSAAGGVVPWYVSGIVDDDSDTDYSMLEAEPYTLYL